MFSLKNYKTERDVCTDSKKWLYNQQHKSSLKVDWVPGVSLVSKNIANNVLNLKLKKYIIQYNIILFTKLDPNVF